MYIICSCRLCSHLVGLDEPDKHREEHGGWGRFRVLAKVLDSGFVNILKDRTWTHLVCSIRFTWWLQSNERQPGLFSHQLQEHPAAPCCYWGTSAEPCFLFLQRTLSLSPPSLAGELAGPAGCCPEKLHTQPSFWVKNCDQSVEIYQIIKSV